MAHLEHLEPHCGK